MAEHELGNDRQAPESPESEESKQNVEQPRGDEKPPFTGPATDPLTTWGTGGSEDDRSGQRSNPRPVQPSADEEPPR
jgi:hypothetical protein